MSSDSLTLPRMILAATLATAACAGRAHVTQPVAAALPAGATTTADPMAGHDMSNMAGHDMSGMVHLPATGGPGYTVEDVHFMQDMIGHHAQAIIMAGKAPSHGASGNVRKLAVKIAISQRDEIVFMKQWLAERKQVVPTESQAMAMMMPGMLTPAMMTQLDASRASEFDKLFLTFMIGHHEGALAMVSTLFKAPPSGQDPEIFRFATDVDTDQRAEIYVMHELLDTIR
ncbi:MAG: DUF305 domain-containing protein [Longimicrobiales bacterium]